MFFNVCVGELRFHGYILHIYRILFSILFQDTRFPQPTLFLIFSHLGEKSRQFLLYDCELESGLLTGEGELTYAKVSPH